MPWPIPLLDHVIVNARDGLDAAASLWQRLGFQLTPRGHHTLGSINNLAMFGTDYIELLGAPTGDTRTDVLDWPPGLNGLIFKTDDADSLAQRLAHAPMLPVQTFSRPVVDEHGATLGEAAFRTLRLDRAAMPAGRVFFCQHLTPGLVWRDDWRTHPNGALGIEAVVLEADDPAALASPFAALFGPASIHPIPGGVALAAGLARIEVLTPEATTERLGPGTPAPDGRPARMVGLVIRTATLATARAALEAGGILSVPHGPLLVVPATAACGLALAFGPTA